jgi:DNA recombination-dependent growth factor C
MFRNLRFYCITNPWPKTEQKLSEILSENAFSPCGVISERSAGWEAPAIKEALEEKCIGIIDRLFRHSDKYQGFDSDRRCDSGAPEPTESSPAK